MNPIPPDNRPSAWLSIADAAAELNVSKRTMERLTSRAAGKDRIVAARFGGLVRIRRTVLETWIRQREA